MSTSLEQRSEANSGLSTGQAAIQFKDEGVNLGTSGTVTAVDFTGAGVTASRAANTVTVNLAAAVGQFPVGSVYENVLDATNPATLLGYGTWLALGASRVLIGIDAGDTDFDTVGETGGAKTKAISAHSGTAVNAHSGTAVDAHSGTAVNAHSGTAVADHPTTAFNHAHGAGTLVSNDHTGASMSHVHNFTTGSITGSGDIGDKIGSGVSVTGTTGDNGPATLTHTISGSVTLGGTAVDVLHSVTQPSSHVVTQPSNHVVTQPNAHVVTQPSNHVVTQPSNHVVTQPSAHADLNVVQPYIVVHRWYRSA